MDDNHIEPIVFENVATSDGKKTFVYDYENMSLEQCFDAETKWMLFNKLFTVLPQTPDDYQKAVSRIAKAEAMASLLTIKDGDKYEYVPGLNREALSHFKTSDRAKLEAAKENFFSIIGIISVESVMQYADTMKLATVTEEYRTLATNEMRTVLKDLLSEMFIKNFIPIPTGPNLDNFSIGK